MRKKEFTQKCKKVFTAILAAAVVMTTTVPESMVFAAENDAAEVDSQNEDEQESFEEVEVQEDNADGADTAIYSDGENPETEADAQDENDETVDFDMNDSDISMFDDGSNASPVAEADGDSDTQPFDITVSMVTSLRYGYTSPNQTQIYVSNGTGRIDSNRKCWLEGEDKDAFECYPSSSTNSIWYIKPKVGLTPKTYTATLHATYLGEEATKEISLTVLPQTIYVKWGEHEFTYDKEKHAPVAELTSGSSFLPGDACHLEVEGAETNAGTYTATAKVVTENGNEDPRYKVYSSQETQSFTINPRPVEFEWDYEDGHVFEYDGQPHTLIATATGVLDGDTCNPVYEDAAPSILPGTTGKKRYLVRIIDVTNSNYTTKHGSQLYVNRGFYITQKKISKITLNPKKAKQYDGTTTFSTSSSYYDYADGAFVSEIEGLVKGDKVYVSSIQSKSAILDNKDVGTGKALTLNVYIGGTDSYKYDFSGIQVGTSKIYKATGTAAVEPRPVNLQWDTNKFTYDGNEHTPVATIKNGVLTDEICKVNSVSVSGENLTEGKAVNVGTYTATAALDNPNYIPKVADNAFTIEKAGSDVVNVVKAENLIYNGDEQKLITREETKGGTIRFKVGKDGIWQDTIPTATDAGEYEVFYYVKGDANHKDNGSEENPMGSCTVTIEKKKIGASAAGSEGIYDENISRSILVDVTEPAEGYRITYSKTGVEGSYTEENPSFTDVGEHTVYYRVEAGNNYAAAEGSATVKITAATFDKGDITAAGYEETYDGASHKISVETKGTAAGATVTYSVTGDADSYTADVPEFKDATKNVQTVYYKVSKKGYNDVTGSEIVFIGRKNVTARVSVKDKVYDGTTEAAVDATVETGIANETLTISDVAGTFAGKDAGEDIEVGINSDKMTVTAGAGTKAENYYVFCETRASGKITARPVTVTITPNGGIYGSVKGAEAVLDGVVKADQGSVPVKLIYTGNSYDSATVPTQAGTYTVTASIENKNYVLTGTDSAEFVIAKAEITAPEIKTAQYNGETQTADVKDTDLYTVTENKGGKNVGNYPVILTLKDTANYKWKDTENTEQDLTFTVTARPLTIKVNDESSTYGDTDPEYSIQITDGILADKDDLEMAYSREPGNAAGAYTITASSANNNYTVTVEPGTLTIQKKDLTIVPDTEQKKVYGSDDPQFKYSVDGLVNDEKAADVLTGILGRTEGENKGKYAYVTGTLADVSGNYNVILDDKAATFEITAKPVTVTPDDAKKYSGEADPKLSYKASGLVGRDTLSGITLTRKAGEKIGKYDITASAEKDANPNYSITFEKAVFTIMQGDQSKLKAKSVAKLDLPLLLAKGQGANKSIKLSWLKYKGATGYDCYWSYCDGKQNYKKFATVKNGKLTATHKKLKNNRKYKYFVVAYKMVDGRKIYVAKSNVLHVAMKEAAQTNAKSVSVNKTKVSLRNGKTFRIKAGVKLESRGKKEVSHASAFRYYTVNSSVATVSSKGVIKARGKGTTYVYVLANNGAYKKIKVTVK